MNSQNRPFLSIKEVSDLLEISISTINKLVKKGEFPSKIKLSSRRIDFMMGGLADLVDIYD